MLTKEKYNDEMSRIIEKINQNESTESHSFVGHVQGIIRGLHLYGMRKNKTEMSNKAIVKSCQRALQKADEIDSLIEYNHESRGYLLKEDNAENRKSTYRKLEQVMKHVYYLLSEYHEQRDAEIGLVKLKKDYERAKKIR